MARGPALRASHSPALFDALREHYGLDAAQSAIDLGGSSNLNLLLSDPVSGHRYVARVYRPWIIPARLADMQLVRRHLADGGVPCMVPLPTLDGQPWIEVAGHLVEVEPYVEHDAKMDSWERIEAGLPSLGRIHTLLRGLHVSEDGRNAPATNNIEPEDALPGTLRGIAAIKSWDSPSAAEIRLAAASEELARLVDAEQRKLGIERLPRQLVHGDYWDNNVFFSHGRIVLIADFDFMGERARIDDLALTLYYTNSTFAENRASEDRINRLSRLVNAYKSSLDEPLTTGERLALPLALARAPLAFIAMIPSVDAESGAHKLAAEMVPDVEWALDIVRNLERWQAAFASPATLNTGWRDEPTIGQRGPDDGIIARDEEYKGRARITLECKNPSAPYAIVFSVLGTLLVTEYYASEEEAQRVFEALKPDLAHICDLSLTEADLSAQKDVDEAIAVLAHRFGL